MIENKFFSKHIPLEIAVRTLLTAISVFIRFLFRDTDKSTELCHNKKHKVMEKVKFQNLLMKAALAHVFVAAIACENLDDDLGKHAEGTGGVSVGLNEVAQILSAVSLQSDHLEEVYQAVMSSSENGYDEEYTMKDLFESPGRGVGQEKLGTKSVQTRTYENPLKELIEQQVRSMAATKSGEGLRCTPEEYLAALTSSDIQIYWPFSEEWDGRTMPVITFDPEDDSDANIGYRLVVNDDGSRHVEEIVVDEELASREPVWVVNRNSDADYTSLEVLRRKDPLWGEGGGTIIVNPSTKSASSDLQTLVLKNFTMNKHYDSWFAGASEFFVKVGYVDGYTAATEAELKMYNPQMTDFMVVVKRNQIGKPQPLNAMLISDWNNQMTHCALIMTEDDGGTRTEWKCTALVRIKSKSYGVEMNIPFNTRDDLVWRGQLAHRWLEENENITGSFGDIDLTFEFMEY